jgi:hypothetical protein
MRELPITILYHSLMSDGRHVFHDMWHTFQLRLAEIRPTQLYINASKLAYLSAKYPPGTETTMMPIPITRIFDKIAFTDGHTRAFLTWTRGLELVNVYWDESELDMIVYEQCFTWCEAEAIRTIVDLKSRIIDASEYKAKWIDRCAAINTR